MAPAPRICLLNSPRLVLADGVEHPLERKDAALLALLAIDGPAQRAKVSALLWPDTSERQARTNLRQRLFRLRRDAGRDLVLDAGGLRLVDGLSLDLADVPRRLAGDFDASPGDLLGALDYGECEELDRWVSGARKRWRDSCNESLARIASEHEAAGRIATALTHAQRLVERDPLLEHAHRRLMRLHYLRGDRAAALAAFERCRQTLKSQLGANPGAETLQLAELVESAEAAPRPSLPQRPVATLRPPRLVGRDAEWRVLQGARLALITGEPGIGKTRLLADFAASEHRAPTFGARPGDSALPYALLARIVRGIEQGFGPPGSAWARQELARIVPELGAAPSAPLAPLRLQQALVQALSDWRVAGLTLLAIDDLQFADDATLELLLPLIGAGAEPRLAWLLAAREHEMPARLSEWLNANPASELRRVVMSPLDRPAVQALLASLALRGLDAAAWTAPLVRHTGGNPMFILETLIAMLDADPAAAAGRPPELPAPAHVGALIERRLGQLGAPALKLARVAALSGQDFDAELATAVLRQHPLDVADAWRELEAAQVIRDNSFAHDLIFEATLRSVPEAVARLMHRDIAQLLQLRAAPAARVALHWQAAGEFAAAARSFEAAAQHARAHAAPREELQALDAAARCHLAAADANGDANGDARFDCECRSVHLLLSLQSADSALARAIALCERACTDRQRASAYEAHAHVLNERYESAAALAAARMSESLAAAAGEPRLALLAAQRAAGALMRLAQPAAAVAAQQAHIDQLECLGSEERLFWLSDHATALDYADRRIEALAIYDRTIDEAERLGHWSAASEAWCNKASALLYLGRGADNLHATMRGLDCGQRAGIDRSNLLIDEMNLAGALRDSGRFAEYLLRAEPLPQALREAGYPLWALNAENDLAVCFDWLGRPELARQALSPLPDDVPPVMRAARLFTQARLLRGHPPAAGQASPAQLVQQAHALIEAAGGPGRSYVRLKVALELARDEEAALALEHTASIAAEATQRQQFMLAGHALMLRLSLLLERGDTAAAASAGHELLDRCLRDGPPPATYAPEPWWLAHRALAAAHRHDAAALALQRAVQWIEQTALPQLPEVFRRSFLERNPINVAILRAVARPSSR